MLRTVTAVRYSMPLKEGGSLPGLMEGDDDGFYVVKFRSAGQGPLALIAEVLAGELATAVGLQVPERVRIQMDAALGRNEPDPEIRALLIGSAGLNVGLDFLPGAANFEPLADAPPDPALASRAVLFDAFISNPDRTARNTNLLTWQKALWLIDHGAAFYFHHAWSADAAEGGWNKPFPLIGQHVLLRWATALDAAVKHFAQALTAEVIGAAVEEIPAEWLNASGKNFRSADAQRLAYRRWLERRLGIIATLAEEAEGARQKLI